MSRALTLAVKNFSSHYTNLSVGRVQTPTMKFLADREKEIQTFVPIPFWKIFAKVKIGKRLFDVDYEKPRIDREDEAKECTILCVDEIINVLNGDPIFHEGLIKYWKEVKYKTKKL